MRSRVILVEDDAALRESLSNWLAREYLVVSFNSAEAFLRSLNDYGFKDEIKTCILLDFQMPGMNGVELQNRLREMHIAYPIIFTSGNAQQADIIDAWRGGAVDFLLKPFTGAKVSEVLQILFEKSSAIPLANLSANNHATLMPISQREAQVLLLLGQGYRQHEIANMLNVTLRTIKWHRASIKNKLGLNTLVEIARYCDQHHSLIKKLVDTSSV
ncbi:MAG: response regulator [Polynucleobacter sp.]|nr:response regulator [Polynucleobacter sp.]